MLKYLKLYYKPLLLSIVLAFGALIITNTFSFFFLNHIMLLIPFLFVAETRSKNKTDEMINLTIISVIYLLFNPVNILLQLWLIIGVLGFYLYFTKHEIRESKISNLSNIIVLSAIFVAGYYLLTTIINHQSLALDLRVLMTLIGNIVSLVIMVYIGLIYRYYNPIKQGKYNFD